MPITGESVRDWNRIIDNPPIAENKRCQIMYLLFSGSFFEGLQRLQLDVANFCLWSCFLQGIAVMSKLPPKFNVIEYKDVSKISKETKFVLDLNYHKGRTIFFYRLE